MSQFVTPHTQRALEQEMDNAQMLIDDSNTGYPDATYEDGVIETLRWVLGFCPPPTSDAIEHLEQ